MKMSEKMSIKEAIKKYPEIEKEVLEQLNFFDLRQGKRWCLHCESVIEVKNIKIEIELYERPKNKISFVWLSCPNGNCNGSPVDWFEEKEGVRYAQK